MITTITGAKVNALDGLGQTALHRCARRDAAAACRLLLAHRSDPQLISLQGYTALQLAGDNAAPILQGNLSRTLQKCLVYFFDYSNDKIFNRRS